MITVYYFDIEKHRQMLRHESMLREKGKDQKVLREKKQLEMIASEYLKRYVFEEVLHKNYPEELFRGEFGKPYCRDQFCCFKVSGQKDFIVLGLTQKDSIGIDIEKKRELPGTAVGSFFYGNEWDTILNDPKEFTRIWTRKEAFVKCIGTGWKHKPDICVVDDQISFDGKKYQIASWEFHDDYVISVCYEDAGYKHQYEMVEVI